MKWMVFQRHEESLWRLLGQFEGERDTDAVRAASDAWNEGGEFWAAPVNGSSPTTLWVDAKEPVSA